MTTYEAFEIVLDLARQNVVDGDQPELKAERARQLLAIEIVQFRSTAWRKEETK